MSVHDDSIARYPAVTPSGNADDARRNCPNRARFVIPQDDLPAHALGLDDLAAYIRHHLPRNAKARTGGDA